MAQPETGKADDTGAAVAFWAFLHGFATIEAAGQFGAREATRGGARRCWGGLRL
ncbi:MAG: WHG domain-containing protein [Acidobacteria bacterium]|nr:WHG domain-containing protein [Acidobacteriota bacterium]